MKKEREIIEREIIPGIIYKSRTISGTRSYSTPDGKFEIDKEVYADENVFLKNLDSTMNLANPTDKERILFLANLCLDMIVRYTNDDCTGEHSEGYEQILPFIKEIIASARENTIELIGAEGYESLSVREDPQLGEFIRRRNFSTQELGECIPIGGDKEEFFRKRRETELLEEKDG